MSTILTNIMTCWKPQQPQLDLPSQPSINDLDEQYFQPCEIHNKQIMFICRNEDCRDNNNSMACNQCLIEHKNHNWVTKQQFLTPNIKNILCFHHAQTDQILNNTSNNLINHINSIEQSIKNQFNEIKDQLQESIHNIQQKYRFSVQKALGTQRIILNKIKLQKLLNIYEIQASKFKWIKIMQENLIKIFDKINISFKNLLKDMYNLSNAQKWEQKSSQVDQFKQFQKHLHQHIEDDNRYYKFSENQKHINIKLNKSINQALYKRAIPSKPLALTTQNITQVHNKFGFQIIKMNTKAIFFDSTTIFLGICNANMLKSIGYRKANEFGKGAYLISSQGWTYHSTLQEYNNKQIVGWGFGQGDIIIVEIKFSTQCMIKFTKKSRFFKNSFEMPLKLNEFQMNRLKPCVGFDLQQGAVVRIFDVNQIEPASQEAMVSLSDAYLSREITNDSF